MIPSGAGERPLGGPIALVVNPRAGRGEPGPGALERDLLLAARAAGRTATLARSEGPGHAEALSRRAVAEGASVVVAVGGDGTVNQVARGLLGSGAHLGIVARGSGNGLARDLGLSLEPRQAIAEILAGRTRRIDAGTLDQHLFLMTAGFGIDARVAAGFAERSGSGRGQLGYFALGLPTFLRYRPPCLILKVDGAREEEHRPLLLVLANTRQFGSGAVVAPTASPEDGLLDLVLVPRLGLGRALWYALKLFAGNLDLAPGVSLRRVTEVEVRGPGPLEAQVDGEPLKLGPRAVARVLPGALSVVVP